MRPPAADARRGGGFATGENSWGHRARSAGTRGVRFGASPHRCGRKALPPCGEAAVKGRWAGVPIDPLAYGSSTCGFALRNLHKSPGLRVGDLAASAVDFRVAGTLRPAAIGAGFARLVAGWGRTRPVPALRARKNAFSVQKCGLGTGARPWGTGRLRRRGRDLGKRPRLPFERVSPGRGTPSGRLRNAPFPSQTAILERERGNMGAAQPFSKEDGDRGGGRAGLRLNVNLRGGRRERRRGWAEGPHGQAWRASGESVRSGARETESRTPWSKRAFTVGTENASFDHKFEHGLLSWGFAAGSKGLDGWRSGFSGQTGRFTSSERRF